MIAVFIADDHKIFRDGITSLLENEEDIQVIGEAGNEEDIFRQLPGLQPDLVLMDISLGATNGIDATEKILRLFPHIKILALSMHSETSYILKMLEAGASGYLLKDAGSREMVAAIRAVASGNTYFSQQVSQTLLHHLSGNKKVKEKMSGVPLTKREIEVLQLIAEEYSNPEIAEKLYISIRTVDTHRRNLLEKLGVKNTAGLVKNAIRLGLIPT
ncbi:MAG: response regulator transcription factor [Saprospirales bacterium]|nr:response regulator transcription factor [Saprospirales bacterium]MBK8491450.1 response regulator transcription factor [Saprospirales bacterium]